MNKSQEKSSVGMKNDFMSESWYVSTGAFLDASDCSTSQNWTPYERATFLFNDCWPTKKNFRQHPRSHLSGQVLWVVGCLHPDFKPDQPGESFGNFLWWGVRPECIARLLTETMEIMDLVDTYHVFLSFFFIILNHLKWVFLVNWKEVNWWSCNSNYETFIVVFVMPVYCFKSP